MSSSHGGSGGSGDKNEKTMQVDKCDEDTMMAVTMVASPMRGMREAGIRSQ